MSFDFLTLQEAASQVRVTRRCLDRWIAAGIGPKWHIIGHRKLIRQADLDAWVEGRMAHSQRQSAAAKVEAAPMAPSPAPAACEAAPL